jgi:hypothetical protein
MSLVDDLKEFIRDELKHQSLNTDHTILERRLYLVEQQLKSYTAFVEIECESLRKEREELIKVYGHVRDFELSMITFKEETTKKLDHLFSQLNRPGDLNI